MPVTIKCIECGFVLAEYNDLPRFAIYGSDYLSELVLKYGGKCPKCGHKLPKRTKLPEEMDVEVKGVQKHG